jgi:hypothetical protein
MPPKAHSKKPMKTSISMTGSQCQDGGAHERAPLRSEKVEKEVEDSSLQCLFCDTVFYNGNDKLVDCERCCKWVCQVCAGVTDDAHHVIKQQEDLFHWFCKICKKQALSEMQMGNLIEVKCRAMDEKIDRFKKELDDQLKNELDQVTD